MPLDSLSNSIVRVQPAKWGKIIADLIAAKATKKRLDAEARAADAQVKTLRSQLFPAFSGAPSAVCGHHLMTVTQSAPAAASITLTDGSKVLWSDVTAVMIGGRKIPADRVATLFGGRISSPDIVFTVA